jgi:2-polyprenyl-3-methyl-5-hydroxy-6-metoxy-1,4-benzoquinol methylase
MRTRVLHTGFKAFLRIVDKMAVAPQRFDQYAAIWDACYNDPDKNGGYEYVARHQQALRYINVYISPGTRILDLGCGTGQTAMALAYAGYRMTCVDISSSMLQAARANFAAANLEAKFILGSVDSIVPERGMYSAVLALGLIEYLPNPGQLFQLAAESLAHNGVLIVGFASLGSPFRWIEHPLKRGVAALLHVATRSHHFYDIACHSGGAFSLSQIKTWIELNNMQLVEYTGLAVGWRVKRFWFPAASAVHYMDKHLPPGVLQRMGRCVVVVARRE